MPASLPTPLGFPSSVPLKGSPLLLTLPLLTKGNVFIVSSSHAQARDASSHGTIDRPFATWNYAVSKCTADHGDTILLLPKHKETLSGAAAVKYNVAGVTTVGVGVGDDRPTFTFNTSDATVAISAANTSIGGDIVGKSNVTNVVSPFVITANDVFLQLEWQSGSALLEAATAVLATGVSRLTVRLRYIGFSGGSAGQQALKLDGCSNVRVEVDTYGFLQSGYAWVQMMNTACRDVVVTGTCATSNVTNGSRNVKDTVGSSTWVADILDVSAGMRFIGGSGAPLLPEEEGEEEAAEALTLSDISDQLEQLSRDVAEMKEQFMAMF